MTDLPLVSCIMPTYNRRPFVPRAIEYFQRQDYPHRELIVVDDGTDPVADLVPAGDPAVRYVRLDRRQTVGAKRNLACGHARGEVIVNWDDDDWYAPHRLRYQVEALHAAGADVCGASSLVFLDLRDGLAWRYSYPPGPRQWLAGSTLCFRRAFWDRNRFPDVDVGEDAQFVWSRQPKSAVALPDDSFVVAMIHDRNVSPKRVNGPYWRPHPAEDVRRLLGGDWPLDRGTAAAPAGGPAPAPGAGAPAAPAPLLQPEHVPPMSVAAAAHLALPEFATFNRGQSLPRMRQWELPFAVFQARLSGTMSVLDCTINPCSLEERIRSLFPHVLYRHWNPLQGGHFALPLGVPDGAFDRVICINTLEHLLRPQRDALIRAMAATLKPGGLLILTCDQYPDSFWDSPQLQSMGVMRADRAEVPGGWNRVTPAEWLEACGRYGLAPLLAPAAAPDPAEPGLYRNLEPYPHMAIGGVFQRRPRRQLPRGRRVVLSLLTWNTRDVSLDSVRAYVREAHMLRRTGHDPLICVCDNGSTDGTPAMLEQAAVESDVPIHLILNPENFGSSVGRNQIIDYMLECGGDYLLFMDGDIEVVPGSSLAMLCYMESQGRRLGCVGADSGGQTADRRAATPCQYSLHGRFETTDLVAWTQYGMFRREVFADGVRFDERGPLGRPGWGFEDNDLAFEMEVRGYLNHRFFGMTYLHRNIRSSVRNLRQAGIDPNPLWEARKQFVVDKWQGVPQISAGPLEHVRRLYFRL